MKLKHRFVVLLTLLVVAPLGIAFAQKGMGLTQFVKAEELRKSKKHLEAVAEYDKAIALEADNPAYYFNRGLSYSELKNPERAKESFLKTVALRKDFFKAYEMLARISDALKEYDQAAQYYDQAAEASADKSQKINYLGEAMMVMNKAGKYAEVPKYLAKAKAIDPENPDIAYFEARNQNNLGNHPAVIEAIIKVLANPKLQARPGNELAKYHYEIGLAYYKTQQYALAEPHLKKADFGTFKPKVVEMMPEYYLALANAYYKVFDISKAEEYLNQTLAMRANYREATDLAARLKDLRKDKTPAIKAAMDSIQKEKNETKKLQHYCSLCRYQIDASDFVGAAASAEECLRLNQKNIPFIFYKAIGLHRSGDLDKATFELDKITQIPNLDAETKAWFNFALGLMYRDAKNAQLAGTYLKKAMFGPYEHAARLEMRLLNKGKADELGPGDN